MHAPDRQISLAVAGHLRSRDGGGQFGRRLRIPFAGGLDPYARAKSCGRCGGGGGVGVVGGWVGGAGRGGGGGGVGAGGGGHDVPSSSNLCMSRRLIERSRMSTTHGACACSRPCLVLSIRADPSRIKPSRVSFKCGWLRGMSGLIYFLWPPLGRRASWNRKRPRAAETGQIAPRWISSVAWPIGPTDHPCTRPQAVEIVLGWSMLGLAMRIT